MSTHSNAAMLTVFAVALALTCGLARSGELSQPVSIDAARQAYYSGRYGEALALFERLARDRGDAEAAERAAFMLMQGAALYGSAVRRDMPRATELLLQAARAGRRPAQFMLDMIEQSD
jgi:TPR repeat protein